VHNGVSHVLKPMKESVIKVEVFSTVRKRNAAKTIPKSGTTLRQGGGKDMKKEDMNIASSIPCKSKIKAGEPQNIGATEVTPKLMTALIQGRENDEPMTHQISSLGVPDLTCNNSWNEDGHSKESSIIQFGDLHILSNDTLYPWFKKIFVGTNLKKKVKN
jgi:hypothetical protein